VVGRLGEGGPTAKIVGRLALQDVRVGFGVFHLELLVHGPERWRRRAFENRAMQIEQIP